MERAGHTLKTAARFGGKGFGHEQLAEMQKLIDAENSDLFDVLAYVAYTLPPVTSASGRLLSTSRFIRPGRRRGRSDAPRR